MINPKRKPFTIVIRCTLTGSEWTGVRFTYTVEEAIVSFRRGVSYDKKYRKDFNRVVVCRPATHDEETAHRQMIAAL